MKRSRIVRQFAASLAVVAIAVSSSAAQYAVEVMSYDSGATPAASFVNSAAALGAPERITGEGSFPGAVTPFNPPFLASEIVSVGEGGHLTLRLSNYVIPQASGPEIGVFENVGFIDTDFPNGRAGSPPASFGPFDSAIVDVSEDGIDWVSLGDVTFDIPTNGYSDLTDPFSSTPGSVPSDFQQPFTGSLNDFSGLPYFDAAGPDMQGLLNSSGGGTWLDISGTGLAQVGYVRFSVADDSNSTTRLNFELDAVSVSRAALGPATVPEPTALIPASVGVWLLIVCRRRRFRSTR